MAASALRADSTFCPTLAKNTTEQKTSKRIVLFDKEECNLHWYGPGYQILLRKSSDFRELVQIIFNALKANQQTIFDQNTTLPTLVKFRLFIDVIPVLGLLTNINSAFVLVYLFLMLLVLGSTRPSSPNQLGTSIKNLALNSPHVRTLFHIL